MNIQQIRNKKIINNKMAFIGFLCSCIFYSQSVRCQIIGLGYKNEKKGMFQTTVNLPLTFSKDNWIDFAAGIDFTSKNHLAPSGFSMNASAYHYLIGDDDIQASLIGLETGYLINTGLGNDTYKLTPYVYYERSLFYVRAGVDYYFRLEKGYPFVSIGFGGLHIIRNMKFSF